MTNWIRRVALLNPRRAWQRVICVVCLLGGSVLGAGWYFTAPLEKPANEETGQPTEPVASAPEPGPPGMNPPASAELSPADPREVKPVTWPETRLEGQPAKELLLRVMQAVDRTFRRVASYTLTFRKQERINGKLLPEQTYFLKVRQEPFAIYMKGIEPIAGRELIYAVGHYDNHVIGHPVGMARYLVPRLKVPPDHPMIMSESRHPMNQAGLGNLIHKLLGFRQMDMEEPEEITILDGTTTADGKQWLRSTHIHPLQRPGRPLARSEILYDPVSRLPLRFTGFDWPAEGKADQPLGERYCYDDLDLDAVLTAKDFDPANPEYEFHRF